jgi:hypothetical protein
MGADLRPCLQWRAAVSRGTAMAGMRLSALRLPFLFACYVFLRVIVGKARVHYSRRENNLAHSLSEQQAKRRSERAVLG